nr:hypothetical protein [uncultured Cardiobacterium sp.]
MHYLSPFAYLSRHKGGVVGPPACADCVAENGAYVLSDTSCGLLLAFKLFGRQQVSDHQRRDGADRKMSDTADHVGSQRNKNILRMSGTCPLWAIDFVPFEGDSLERITRSGSQLAPAALFLLGRVYPFSQQQFRLHVRLARLFQAHGRIHPQCKRSVLAKKSVAIAPIFAGRRQIQIETAAIKEFAGLFR